MAKSFGKGPWWRLCAFAKAEGGTALGVSAFSFLILATASGVVIDAGRGYLIKSRLTQAVDSAALASGRVLSDADAKGNSYQSQVQKYFQANFPDGYLGVSASAANLKVRLEGDSLNVTATVQVNSAVMSIVGMEGYNVSASATVNRTVRSLEIAMVIDNSTAMGGKKMKDVRAESKNFLDLLFQAGGSEQSLNVSVVPFTARANVKGQQLVHPDSPPNEDLVCMDIRHGPHAVGESNPTEEPFDHYSGTYSPKKQPKGYELKICPEANVLPLSHDREDVDAALDDMKGKGCRRFDLGAAWGWRALSPAWQDHWEGSSSIPPADYGQSGVTKALVLLTHGKNTKKSCTDDPEEVEETERMFLELCDSMKREGILIYTIAIDVPETVFDKDGEPKKSKSELSRELFEECASGSARAFYPKSMKEMAVALNQVANDLSVLRLSK